VVEAACRRHPLAAYCRPVPKLRIAVRAHPGASRERVSWDGQTLDVWVNDRAVEGAANRAVEAAIARVLGVRKTAVVLVAGERSRYKVAEVTGVESKALERLGGSALAGGPTRDTP
jgi:uncharacterized protein